MTQPIAKGGTRPSRIRRAGLLAGLLAIFATALVSASPAAAAPAWDVYTVWGPTHLPPGGKGDFVVQVKNVGDTASSGAVTVTVDLPDGVTVFAPSPFDGQVMGDGWSCPTPNGKAVLTCTRTGAVQPRSLKRNPNGFAPRVSIPVQIDPAASGTSEQVTTVSGGGAAGPDTDADQVTFSSVPAGFGLVPNSFNGDSWDGEYPGGVPERQAGAHPFELRVDFDFNLEAGTTPSEAPGLISDGMWTKPEGHVRTIETTLPRGFIGNPEALPKCRPEDFQKPGADLDLGATTGCPPNTQVGIMELELNDGNGTTRGGFGFFEAGRFSRVAVYNLEPPKGVPADFGFHVAAADGHIYPTLDPSRNYAITATVPLTTNLAPVRRAHFTMWGVPGDAAHDHLRFERIFQPTMLGAKFDAEIEPLLTMPMECGADRFMDFRADSWQRPGAFVADRQSPFQVGGCGDRRFRFQPKVALQPTNRAAGAPTGLSVELAVPQKNDTVQDGADLYSRSGDVRALPTPPMKKAVVTMPEGMTISTSAAQGLGSCAPDQIRLGTNDPVTCPANSQYGTLTIRTPILPENAPMTGQIYIAKQNDNPFHNFLSLYLAIQEPERGILVKVPGRVDLDPVTGRITTVFDDLPQFPFTSMEMKFKGGVRAALVNPSTCGTKTITAEFTPWNDPGSPIVSHDSYQVSQRPDGSPCVGSLRDRAFGPQMSAGTVNNSAGAYSPFVYRLQRTDDDQELSRLGVGLPKGLLAKIAGIAKCSDAAIAQAEAPGRTGTEERDHPSCPASSQIGSTDVGSGVGQVLTYVPGKAYLAGPYRGAPLSMVVITPILAGPYDLGVIAVRSKIDVDRVTTQATVSTDSLPQIFKGIPVRIRDVRVKVDRQQTMVNPTSCEPKRVTSHVIGTGGDVGSSGDDTAADLSVRFQAADCAALPFKPNLRFRLKGGTHRGDYPAFTATLRARPGDANIARTAVTLPHSEFLAQEHIRTICTRVQYAQDACPKGSVYGYARATSPLFDGALQGPVYLRSSSNPLPDLVAKLDGEIDVELSGRIDSVHQGIRNTFDVVPDAPVTKFVLKMQGGKKGLLVNSRNLCKGRKNRANVRMTGQNGKRHNAKPVVHAAGCKKQRRKAKKKHRRAKGKRGAAQHRARR